jgi:hypothetical protein
MLHCVENRGMEFLRTTTASHYEILVFAAGQFVVGLDPFVRTQPLGSGDQYAYAIYDKVVGGKIQYSVVPRNS